MESSISKAARARSSVGMGSARGARLHLLLRRIVSGADRAWGSRDQTPAPYFYYLDRDFGLMHVRRQTGLPLPIQIYVNGREWLARQLTAAGVAYEPQDNAVIPDDVARAAAMSDRLLSIAWEPWLTRYAVRVNPWLGTAGLCRRYYWSVRESEFATDVLFATKTDLSARYPRRLQHAIEQFTTGDLLRFLGRLVPGRFKARRIARWCIGPKGSAFAIGSMKTRSRGTTQASDSSAWRYLDALSVVGDPTPSHRLLDSVSQRVTRQGRPYRPWRPMSPKEAPLFRTILQGEFTIRGFHNRDLRRYLYPAVDADPEQRRRVSARVTRSLRLLRAHGRITKVTRTRYYRITNKGHHVMTTALRFRETDLALLAA